MEKEHKSTEITREEMIATLENYCLHRDDCISCPLRNATGPLCNNSFSAMTYEKLIERMALLEAEAKRGSRAETPALDEYIFAQDQTAKADAGKAEIRLVPMEIVWAIAWIRMYGNRKYGDPDNWKTVEPERYRDALMRHLLHYISDPKSVDEESGYPHLWHAACNLAFLMHFDYGDMCHYDFAVKKPEWENIGKAVENNRISPSEEMRKLGDYLGDYFANELRKRIENVKDFGEETEA